MDMETSVYVSQNGYNVFLMQNNYAIITMKNTTNNSTNQNHNGHCVFFFSNGHNVYFKLFLIKTIMKLILFWFALAFRGSSCKSQMCKEEHN